MTESINLEHERIIPIREIFKRNDDTGALELDCNELSLNSPKLYEELANNPDRFIQDMKHQLNETFGSSDLPNNILNFNITNYAEKIDISNLRQNNLNKLYIIKGMIKRTTKVITRTNQIKFECVSCSSIISVVQTKKKIQEAMRCSCGNKNPRSFRQLNKNILNIQELNLEELSEESSGKQPQQLRVYLEGDLTDPTFSGRLNPGKRIEVLGIIKELPAFMTKKDEIENISEFMIHAININYLEADEDSKISDEDLIKIKEIAKNNPLEFLANNLSKANYGNEQLKKAIVLQLAKGVQQQRPDGTFTRGDIHILLSGDAGVSKSQLLNATCIKCPRGRYASGTRGSAAGLTSSVNKDELTGEWSVTAGAIVLSSGSILMLDELDKMDKEDLSSLYEPLETQRVTVNKAGINCSLNAKTSILAAANPLRGRFDVSKPLASQIDLPAPLLNRFDLIFVMLDKQREDFDFSSVEHIFNIHSENDKIHEEVTPQFFKKYISYVRKLRPRLRANILPELQKIYIKIRKQTGTTGIPINLRNVEGLIRLSSASAKIRQSDFVELSDLKIAEELFTYSLKQLGYDEETGQLDLSRLTQKVPTSKRGKLESVLALIQSLENKFGKIIPYYEIIGEANNFNIDKWEIDIFLDTLKKEGKIFEPKSGFYSLL
jgi:replicative DNA helicase Mcm